MAGAIGAGGLGDPAARFGYQRLETGVAAAVVAVPTVLACAPRWLGDRVAARPGPATVRRAKGTRRAAAGGKTPGYSTRARRRLCIIARARMSVSSWLFSMDRCNASAN